MSLRKRWSIVLIALLAPMLLTSTAAAQASTVCGLGGQILAQVSYELPLPLSIAPAQGASGSRATIGRSNRHGRPR